jgi:serine protease Do
MKQACRTFVTFLFVAAFFAPVSLLAQKEDKAKDIKERRETEQIIKEQKEAEQIIITRKGNKNEKVVIEIVGDKVTVNGKSIDELKDGNVTVRRHNIHDTWAFADGLKGGGQNYYGPGNFEVFTGGDTNRAMLGVTTEKSEDGVEFQQITKESAAAKAGLKSGDVITKINDKNIETPDDLSAVIKAQKPGDKITVTYLRDKKENKATAELTKWKGVSVYKSTTPGQNFDFQMDNLNLDEIMPRIQTTPRAYQFSTTKGPKLGLSVQDTDDGKGVKILEVDDDSNAAKAGLREDDVITEIDGKKVNSVDEVSKIIRESKEKPSVMMKLQRGSKTQNIEVKIPRKIKSADL